MSEYNKEVADIKKSTVPINPDVHNLKNSMCFKTYNDLIISLPTRTVKWCCKTVISDPEKQKQLTFDLDTLSLDFLINHPILKQRKFDLSGGTQSKDCKICWESEKTSGKSVRTDYNEHFDPMWKHRFQSASNHPKKAIAFNQDMQNRNMFKFIEIELTNKCNMACTYCWEGNSTRWQKELKRRMPDTDDAMFDKTIDILNEWWEKDLHKQEYVAFSLLGGEPFFTDHMYRFMENFLVNLNDTKSDEQTIVINVTTSLNFPDKKFERFIELVERTPNIHYMMQLSGEAIGRKNELIRWGMSWDKWDENLGKFLDSGSRLTNLTNGFGIAHNSLSLPYFKDYLVYLNEKLKKHPQGKDQSVYFHTNWVDNPPHMGVSMLDKKYKQNVQEAIDYFKNEFNHKTYQKDRYVSVLKTVRDMVDSEVTDQQRRWAYKQFSMLEKRRNIDFSEVFPHYNELVGL